MMISEIHKMISSKSWFYASQCTAKVYTAYLWWQKKLVFLNINRSIYNIVS